jgi:two-component system, chemotaxis family, chemotaxis protein CheY
MKKILVVDDSPTVRKLIAYILKKKSYMIAEAQDGLEAMEKLGGLDVDLIIANLNMPKMDGIEFVKNLRNNYHFMDLPVIMLTTTKDDLLKKHALEAGVNMFLNKPIQPEMLLNRIGSLLREEQ